MKDFSFLLLLLLSWPRLDEISEGVPSSMLGFNLSSNWHVDRHKVSSLRDSPKYRIDDFGGKISAGSVEWFTSTMSGLLND